MRLIRTIYKIAFNDQFSMCQIEQFAPLLFLNQRIEQFRLSNLKEIHVYQIDRFCELEFGTEIPTNFVLGEDLCICYQPKPLIFCT